MRAVAAPRLLLTAARLMIQVGQAQRGIFPAKPLPYPLPGGPGRGTFAAPPSIVGYANKPAAYAAGYALPPLRGYRNAAAPRLSEP